MSDYIDKLIAKLPSYTPIKAKAKVAKYGYNTLGKLQSLAAALSQYGVDKLQGEDTTFKQVAATKPNFYDVVNNMASDKEAAVVKNVADKLRQLGITQGISPIFKPALSPEKNIPIGKIQEGLSVVGKQVSKVNPVTAAGSMLAAGLGIEPTIDTNKKISQWDIIKPGVGFVADTYTHPMTAVAGAGSLGVKAIKSAAGPSSTVGADTWEAFAQMYPRAFQMINEAFKGKDPEKIYAIFRSPSKLLSPKLQQSLMKSRRDIGQFTELATKRVRDWAELPTDARKAVGEAVMNNNYSILDSFKVKHPEIKSVAKNFRRLVNKAGLQAVKAGKLDYQTFVKNKDTYVRRMYEYFENHKEWVKANNPEFNLELMLTESPISGSMGEFKVKNALFKPRVATEETQKKLGVLGPEHIGYTAGEGSIRTFRSARNAQMFDEIGSQVAKPLPEEYLNQFPGANLLEKEANAIRQADKVNVGIVNKQSLPVVTIDGQQWARMPKNAGYGAISEKWLPRWDAEHIIGTFKLKGNFLKAYEWTLNAWKSGKVVLSPAAQSRNLMSNAILMTYSGIPIDDALGNIMKSTKAAMSNKPDYIQRAYIRLGGAGKNWADSEALKFGTSFKNVKAASKGAMERKDIANIPGKLYSKTEDIYKTAIMRYWHEKKGLSLEESFKKAQETLFDYSDTSKFIKGVKQTAVPFVTFFSKAIPFTAKSTLSRPQTTLPLVAMKDVFNDYNAKKLGLTEKDLNMLEGRYGQWYLITGGTKQKPDVMDLTYIIPGLTDMAGSQGSRGIFGANSPIPQSLQPSTPFLTPIEALPGVNKMFYFQKPIYSESDIKTSDIKSSIQALVKQGYKLPDAIKTVLGQSSIGKGVGYVAKNILPANPLVPGTFQFEQLKSSLTGMPVSTSGEVQKPTTAIASTVGLKTSPIDLNKIRSINIGQQRKLMKELQGELIRINASKLSPQEKSIRRAAIMLRYKKQIDNLKTYLSTGAKNE